MNNCLFILLFSSKFLLLAAILTGTSALPWSGPKSTITYTPASWIPRPTQDSISEHELSGRDLFFPNYICGWIGGDFSSSLTCPPKSGCVWDTARSFIGCCLLDGPCSTGVYTGCVDPYSKQQTVLDPAVTTCSGTSICYLNSFPSGYYQYGCGLANMAATVETTYLSQPATYHLLIIPTSLDIPAASTISSTVNQSTATTNGGSDNSKPMPVTGHASKIFLDPIIEGAAESFVGLLLLVIVVIYVFYQRKKYIARRFGGKLSN